MSPRSSGSSGRGSLDLLRLDRPVTVRVPASSANLGPGFDSLGLALDLHDEVTVEAREPEGPVATVEVVVEGEGAGSVPGGEDHLVVRSVRQGLAAAGAGRPSLVLRCRNAIPHGRGLGSSAAAVVAGLVAARLLLRDPRPLDDQAVLDLATAAEGHPDNASASLFGGLTVSWWEPHGPRATARSVVLDVHPDVRVVVCVPEVELATSRARAMLPASVPHADAAFTAGRAALLVEALTHRPDLLLPATDERLHQAQRGPAMPSTLALVRALRSAGAAAVVSGAGPSVLVLGAGDEPQAAVRAVLEGAAGGRAAVGPAPWRVLAPAVDVQGARAVTQRAVARA